MSVTVNTWPVTYVYTASDLLLAYGVAFIFALACSAIGLYAFFVNNASYQNLFSTYIRATVDSAIRSQMQSGDDGADPLPSTLAKTRVALGGQREKKDEDAERDDRDDVELQRLGLTETSPDFGLSWNSLNNAGDCESPQDHHASSLCAGEHSLADPEARSIASSVDQVPQDVANVRTQDAEVDRQARQAQPPATDLGVNIASSQ